MNQLDNEFFETYKRLDNICRDMYKTAGEYKAGVKMYLEDMNDNFSQGSRLVQGWREDYQSLKRCKRIRDQLAHSEYYPSEGICSYDDIDFVKCFYERILSQTDPLAELEKQINVLPRTSSRCKSALDDPYEDTSNLSNEKNYFLTAFLLFIFIGIVALLTFLLFLSLISPDLLMGFF